MGAVEFLENSVKSSLSVFEWGTGGSTLYFLDRGLEVTSVEHDSQWLDEVRQRVKPPSTWKANLALPTPLANREVQRADDPYSYHSCSDPTFARYNFEAYVKAIDAFATSSFDVIIIDGRSRSACIRHAVPRLKPGGLLMLDNSDRSHYQVAIRSFLASWQRTDFIGPTNCEVLFSATSIWKKP